jgi:hypothetical protein
LIAAAAETFSAVTISPYTGLLMQGDGFHRGGPAWPDWDKQTFARHNVRGQPDDTEPAPALPLSTLSGLYAWGGPIVNHFGHQIADFSTRLLRTARAWPNATLAFATHPAMDVSSPTKHPFFVSLLEWYGLSLDRVRLFAEPVSVDSLGVVAQAEQRGGPGPDADYLDSLTQLAYEHLGPVRRQGTLYVSRAAYPGRFAGEGYIEEFMRETGCQVVRPEEVSLRDQLHAYRSAERLIFAEGSAIHGAQVLGRDLGDVAVISRRPWGRFAAEHSIQPRARSLRYYQSIRSLLHDVDVSGKPATYFGLALLDEGQLIEALEEIGLPARATWDSRRFAEARDRDVTEWLDREVRSPRWNAPGSVDLVRSTLAAGGLSPDMVTTDYPSSEDPEAT